MRLADNGETWQLVGGCCGRIIGLAGGTLWLANDDALVRVDPATGTVVATIDLAGAQAMTAGGDVAWFALPEGTAPILRRVHISDNTVLDDLPVSAIPTEIWAEGSILWMTDFSASELWRIDTGG